MPAGTRGLVITDLLRPDKLATAISERWNEWEMQREEWSAQKREIRNYIFATDTYNTTNGVLDWKNSTHVPKLCNIRDNLHSNYMAALFPTDAPIRWEGDDESSEALAKRTAIQAYMTNKMRVSNFRNTVSQIVLDYIDYGNCFGTIEFVAEMREDGVTGEKVMGYSGPRLVRISPFDIVFNPTASSFAESPKIIRSIKTLASLKSEMEDHPESNYFLEVWDDILERRSKFTGLSEADFAKERDSVYHTKTDAMNKATTFWPIMHVCILLATGFTQANHIVQFFKKRRII